MDVPLSEPFFSRRVKMPSRLDCFMLYDELGDEFFSFSELLFPNMKIRLRRLTAWSKFYMISDNPKISLGIVDCSFYTRRIALKDEYQKKKTGMFAYTPVEFNFLESLARTFIIPAWQSTSFKKTFLSMLQFVELPLQWIQTLLLLKRTLKIHSGINNLISDKLEYSEEVSQF